MITLAPAMAWGFADRGLLREGMVADLNVFDPDRVGPGVPGVVHDLPGGASPSNNGPSASRPRPSTASSRSSTASTPGDAGPAGSQPAGPEGRLIHHRAPAIHHFRQAERPKRNHAALC